MPLESIPVSSGPKRMASPADSFKSAPSGERPPEPPKQRSSGRGEHAERDEHDADLGGLGPEHQVRRKAGEDLLELVRAFGRVVRAACETGHFLERVLVDAAPETPAATATEPTAAEPATAEPA